MTQATTQVIMPQLGESVTEGTIARWLKQPGEEVRRFEPLVEVVTDKVTAEVPAPAGGVLEAILVPEGETVRVGTPIATLRGAEATAAVSAAGGGPGEAARAEPAPAAAPEAGASPGTQAAPAGGEGADGLHPWRGRYSPVVRRLAREHGIDLDSLRGTGAHGRVTREDVLAALERRKEEATAGLRSEATAGTEAQAAPAPVPQAPAAAPAAQAAPGGDRLVPLDPIRRTMARRMVEAKQTIPHAWTMVEVDVTGLARLRERVQEEFRRREGFELTFLPFMLEAVARALGDFPMLNATWTEEGVLLHQAVHLGIAVAADSGLVVPVIRNADALSLVGLARAARQLAEKARAGRLALEDVQGGTFTVDNTGATGSVLSYPIINPPQVAIITMERVVKRPVVVETADGEGLAVRSMMNVCLSIDHRVIDGALAGRFLAAVRRRLEGYRPEQEFL